MIALAPLAAAAVVYVAAARRTARWPMARTVAWLAGLGVMGIALVSGLDAAADQRLSAHMAQHVLLTLVAPPLLLAGAPVRLALRTGGPETRRALARLMRGRLAGVLTHPVVAWSAFAGVMLVTHLTGLYSLAVRHDTVHALEHAAYFWSAVLFWLPLAGAAPVPHRLGPVAMLAYLMTAMAAMAVVGVALGAPEVRYSEYASLDDQHLAAGIMIGTGAIATLVATFAVLWPALLREERHAQARERLQAGGGAT
jgi:putative membrane protein